MNACPWAEELILLIDGELTENRANEVRAHAKSCNACREELAAIDELLNDVAAPVVAVDVDAMVDRVAAAIEAEPKKRTARPKRGRVPIFAVAVVAMAAAFLLLPRIMTDRGEFTSRGTSRAPSAAREVGVTLFCDRKPCESGDASTKVEPRTPYSVGYETRPATRPYWLMVVAIDAKRELHWIVPPYLHEREDPQSLELPPGRYGARTPTSAILERPSKGALQLVAIITEKPVRVKEIESLPSIDRTPEALGRHFPGADVRVWSAVVEEK